LSAEALARAAFALLLLAGPAAADVFRSGELRLEAGEAPGTFELVANLPASAARTTTIEWPSGCRQTDLRVQALGDGRTLLHYRAACERAPGLRDLIRTPWQVDAARLDHELAGTPSSVTLTPSANGLYIPFRTAGGADRSWTELAPEMLWQGMLHIWLGWDHLAFVLCLCMLARGLELLALVTAFTLGHSLSLGLAFFEVVSIPVAPTEALIALSIVLVAREGLLARTESQRSGSVSRAALVVVVFGLVHGLGFASALGELGISPGERWPALLFFNLGVEIGQLVFVTALLTLGVALRPAFAATARAAALYAAGIVGSFWLVERVAGYGWS
jgi:hypothetical protein